MSSLFCAEQRLAAACGRFYLIDGILQDGSFRDGLFHPKSSRELSPRASLHGAAEAVTDWPAWLRLVRFHRLDALAAKALLDQPPDCLPAAIADELRDGAKQHATRSLALIQTLLELSGALKEAEIPVLSLKGPALGIRAYGNAGLRPCRDLDVLVPTEHVRRAHEVMLGLGFRVVSPAGRLDFPLLTAVDKHIVYARGDLPVELHWRLDTGLQRFPLAPARHALTDPGHDNLGAGRVAVLPLELRLLYLAFHGAKHGWQQWLWLLDPLALICRRPEPDWANLRGQAKALGLSRTWRATLSLAQSVFAVPLPPGVAASDADTHHERVCAYFFQLQGRSAELPTDLSSRDGFCLSWHLRESFRARLVFMWRVLVVAKPADIQWLRLPGGLRFLYPLLRPLRLLWSRIGRKQSSTKR